LKGRKSCNKYFIALMLGGGTAGLFGSAPRVCGDRKNEPGFRALSTIL
jgi:hypothetical protein